MLTTQTPRRFATVARALMIAGVAIVVAGAETASARMPGVIDLTRPDGQTSALVRGPGLTVIRNDRTSACASGGYLARQRCGSRVRHGLSTLARPGSQPPVVTQREPEMHAMAPTHRPAPAKPAIDAKVALAKRATQAAMGGHIDCSAPDARFWKECTGVAPLAPVAPAKPEPTATPAPTPPCKGAFWGLLPCPKPAAIGDVLAGDADGAPDAPDTPDTPDAPDTPDTPPGACES